MEKRISVIVLAFLLSSTLSLPSEDGSPSGDVLGELLPSSTRIEISPDPNSIRDLGSPTISEGKEGERGLWADSSIGTYTTSGLNLDNDVPSDMLEPRSDLMVVLVSSENGLWESRVAILEAADVAVRATIPPSGFLVQGTIEELLSVSRLPFVEASHTVPLALLVEKRLWEQQNTSEVEVIGLSLIHI